MGGGDDGEFEGASLRGEWADGKQSTVGVVVTWERRRGGGGYEARMKGDGVCSVVSERTGREVRV